MPALCRTAARINVIWQQPVTRTKGRDRDRAWPRKGCSGSARNRRCSLSHIGEGCLLAALLWRVGISISCNFVAASAAQRQGGQSQSADPPSSAPPPIRTPWREHLSPSLSASDSCNSSRATTSTTILLSRSPHTHPSKWSSHSSSPAPPSAQYVSRPHALDGSTDQPRSQNGTETMTTRRNSKMDSSTDNPHDFRPIFAAGDDH